MNTKIIKIQDNLLDILATIDSLELLFSSFEMISNFENNIENRIMYKNEVFDDGISLYNSLLEKIVINLNDTRSICLEDTKLFIQKYIPFIVEDRLNEFTDLLKSPQNLKDFYRENNIEVTEEKYTEDYEILLTDSTIRIFVHQVFKIHAMSNLSSSHRMLKKEVRENKTVKENNFYMEKLKLSKFNIYRMRDEVRLLNRVHGENIYKKKSFFIEKVIMLLEVYKDNLQNYWYGGKEHFVNLEIASSCNHCLMYTDINKLMEIIEVIIFNAAEEICTNENKDIDKTVYVSISCNNSEKIHITIKDKGRGIDDIEKIFHLNYTTKASSGGSGLGLAAVVKVANDLGICILVDSTVGEGSRFVITLDSIVEN